MECKKCGRTKRKRPPRKDGTSAGWRCRVCDKKPSLAGTISNGTSARVSSPLSLTDAELDEVAQITDEQRQVLAEPHRYGAREIAWAQTSYLATVMGMEQRKRLKNQQKADATKAARFCETCEIECGQAEKYDEVID